MTETSEASAPDLGERLRTMRETMIEHLARAEYIEPAHLTLLANIQVALQAWRESGDAA